MATRVDVKQALYDEFATVVANAASESGNLSNVTDFSVTDAYDHVTVDRLDGDGDVQYPCISFDEFVRPKNRGLHGNTRLESIDTDVSGTPNGATYRADVEMRVDVTVEMDDSDEGIKDLLYATLVSHFDSFNTHRDPSEIHADIEALDVSEGNSADRPDDDVRGETVQLHLEYARFHEWDGLDPMSSIDFDLDVGADGSVEGTDAIDETIS